MASKGSLLPAFCSNKLINLLAMLMENRNMSFNTEELYVLRSHLALGQTPTQADLEAAAEFSNIRAFARDLVAGNTQSDEDFVSSLYENLLDRTPAAEEVQWWAEQMDQGLRSLTKAQILLAFQDAAASEEGGVANAKVEALGLESIDLEFGSTGPVDPIDPIDPVEFNINIADASSAQNNTWSIGREAIDAGQATLSNQYTISLKNQLNDAGLTPVASGNPEEVYNAYFLSPLLSNIQSSTTQSELVLEVIDRHAETSADALKFMAIQSFNFFYNGENIVVSSEAILNASTYEELRAAIEAALVADGRGDEFTVRLGSDFERQQTDPNTQEFTGERLVGQQIVIEATGDGEIVRGGFETGAKPNANQNIDVAARMDDSAETTVSTALISTNIELQNIGYGSQGAGLNVSGQSQSNKAIQEFKIDAQAHSLASLGVWLKSLSSNPFRDPTHQGLERVELTGSAPYFHVGNQGGENVVRGNGGIVDVREFAAGNFGGNIQLDATITSNIIDRDFNRVDTDNNPARDNTPAEYNLGRGDDRLLIDVAVEALAHEDFALNINTGAGNDYVHLRLTEVGGLNQNGNQFANHQMLNNITIEARSGNNTIHTEGAGNATIITGGGRDTIMTDNSAAKATWVYNAANTQSDDLLGQNLAPQLFYGAQLRVTFAPGESAAFGQAGFESVVNIPTADGFYGNQSHVNQAIKKAINEDDVLSKLLVAKDGPNNTLIIESKIDGEMQQDSISFDIVHANADSQDDAGYLSQTQINALTAKLREIDGDSTATYTRAEIQARLDAAAVADSPAGANTGDNPFAALPDVAETTPGVAEVLAVQTFDFTANAAQTVDETGTITITIDGRVFTATSDAGGATVASLLEQFNNVTLGSYTATVAGNVVSITQTAGNGRPVGAGVVADGVIYTGTFDPAETVVVADGTGASVVGVEADAEVQTLTFAAATANGTLRVAGQDVEVEAGDTAAVVAGKVKAVLDAAVADLDGITADTQIVVAGNTLVITFDEDAGDVADITVSQVGAGGSFGANSNANTDNVINAGAGNDVIILSTSTNAEEVIQITGTNNGYNTIVNFQDGNAAGADQLDFTAYLTTRVPGQDSTSLVSSSLESIGLSANIAANKVTVIDFNTNADDNETFDRLTANVLRNALNDEDGFGGLNEDLLTGFDKGDFRGDSYKAVIMVQNELNQGEYKAFEVTVGLDNDGDATATSVNLIGTYDFGSELTLVDANITGFVA
ncbi:DUF4214 domain-containing protein [Marinospirillum sp. MEB164]|uniref:DUF4214 domain-containing protein n=1 Tax=Marinospirillum alkalitolerans TaxID=3123374 RepID=A0ABW8PUX7_9GAMM